MDDEAIELKRAQRRERMRAWNQKNKAKYQENRRLASKRWREKQPESYKKAYQDQNLKRREKNRAYNQIPEVRARRTQKQRERRANDPEKYKLGQRASYLKKKYKITLEEWEVLFSQQGRVCAGCGCPDPGANGWHVDHCHENCVVRGILCMRCNTVLGYANDRPDTLRSLAAYLEKTP